MYRTHKQTQQNDTNEIEIDLTPKHNKLSLPFSSQRQETFNSEDLKDPKEVYHMKD